MKVTHIHTCRFHFPVGVWTFSDSLIVQSVRIPQWLSPFFIFLDWRLCTLLNLCVCELSRHKWGRPHLRTARPPKVPLTEKCYALYWNHRGMSSPDRFSGGVFPCHHGRKSVSIFLQVASHLEAPAAGERGSGKTDVWMLRGLWKSSLSTSF